MLAEHFTEWAEARGIKRWYIPPGKPDQSAFIERFNRSFRTEVLDAHLFGSIEQVQDFANAWIADYNEHRPHEALSNVPPVHFLPRLTIAVDSTNRLST